jgi:hypothetical protein
MKALWFMPFTFAAGAEGFALFAPYLLALLAVLYVAGASGPHCRAALAAFRARRQRPVFALPPDAQPAL